MTTAGAAVRERRVDAEGGDFFFGSGDLRDGSVASSMTKSNGRSLRAGSFLA